jgi:ATP-dependent DNA helicase UvrD/PcrA
MRGLDPTPEQQAILDLGLDSIRVSAGAGTGKTTTVAMAIANLVANHGIDPENVLGITFTNKAASELADRVRTYLGGDVDPGREVEVHTYHGFAAQILSEFGLLAGLDQRAEVITPTFSRQLLNETFLTTDYEILDITWSGRLAQIKQLGDRLGDHLLEPADLLDSDHGDDKPWPERVEMLQTLERYLEDKKSLSVVDYADLITLATRLVTSNQNVAETIRERYRVVVLDEYQDTNPAQRILLTSLFGNGFPVIAVGDADQTIYEWRGASAENFNCFPDHFSRPDGGKPHLKELTDNYRSGQNILDLANEIRKQANPVASALHSPNRTDASIETRWAGTAMVEAEWIARRFEEIHDNGTPWSDMAVLFRKNKDFAMVVGAFADHEIPIEVANLGGLLSIPEIAEIRAWMTLLARPGDAGSALQVLTGSRYRLGLADMAPISRWIRANSESHPEHVPPITFVEGIEALAEIDELRDGARFGYQHFLDTYLGLLKDTQGASLVEVARLILDRTRSWSDIEALPEVARLTARLNIYRFLDLAEDWSPLRGRSSLSVFLDYLDTMEDEPAEELDAARLSGEDAVTLVTVHRAKGLEWEVVAVPALAHGNFPGTPSMHPDPKNASVLPPEFRVDSMFDAMPVEQKLRTEFLREMNLNQEWRVAYVAATRAKSHLLASGAYWYGHPEPTVHPKKPSVIFELIDSSPHSVDSGKDEEPDRPELLRRPSPDADPDPVFPDGWVTSLRSAIADPNFIPALADQVNVGSEFAVNEAQWSERLFELPDRLEVEEQAGPTTVSVTGLVTYAGCPKQYFWSEVDRLPRRRNPAAVAGTEVHRRIELHQKGAIPFEELSREIYDVPDGDFRPGAFRTFESSRFATTPAARVEAPFTLAVGDNLKIRGRIDAIYDEDGHWEIVDFKSGRPGSNPARTVQLEAYAVACSDIDFGLSPMKSVSVTFAYLGDGLTEETTPVDNQWLSAARSHLEDLGAAIVDGQFDPTPSQQCRSCDFLQFCAAGTQYLNQ